MSACKVITVMNMKGGVGKTTISAHISWALSQIKLDEKKPLNILMIDYDPQFNLSQMYVKDQEYFSLEGDKKTVYSVLVENNDDINPYHIQSTAEKDPPKVDEISKNIFEYGDDSGCLDIIISTLDMMYLALGSGSVRNSSIEDRFRKFILSSKNKYDLIIIDCHPAGSIFTKTALFNSDFVLIPVVPTYHSARGIALMMRFIGYTKESGCSAHPIILFNGTKTETSSEELEIRSNERYGKYCLSETLRYSKLFKLPVDKADKKGFLWEIPPNDPRCQEKEEVLENLKTVVKSIKMKVGI